MLVCSAELSVAELREMHAKTLELTRWIEEELKRREERQPGPSAAPEQPQCVPARAVDAPAALWCASRVLTRRMRACRRTSKLYVPGKALASKVEEYIWALLVLRWMSGRSHPGETAPRFG